MNQSQLLLLQADDRGVLSEVSFRFACPRYMRVNAVIETIIVLVERTILVLFKFLIRFFSFPQLSKPSSF